MIQIFKENVIFNLTQLFSRLPFLQLDISRAEQLMYHNCRNKVYMRNKWDRSVKRSK